MEVATIKKKVTYDAVAGACAGVLSRVISAPLDVIKIRFQLQFHDGARYTSIYHGLSSIYKEEGFLSLWKGNLSASYLWLFYSMVQFSIYGALKRTGDVFPDPFASKSPTTSTATRSHPPLLMERSTLWKGLLSFIAGAGAGAGGTIITYPFDIMRTQFAIQGTTRTYPTILSFVTHTYRAHNGLRGFYAGSTAAIVGIAPYMGFNFAIYESSKIVLAKFIDDRKLMTELKNLSILNDKSSSNNSTSSSGSSSGNSSSSNSSAVWQKSVCGGLAGGCSKLIVFPLDTIKKRLQAQVLVSTMSVAGQVPRYDGLVNCATTIWRTEGIKGLYKGLAPTMAKAVVGNSVAFTTYEVLRDALTAMNA